MVIPCLYSFLLTVLRTLAVGFPVNKKRTRALSHRESGSSTNCMVDGTGLEPLCRHLVAAFGALQAKKWRNICAFQPLLMSFFELILMQGDAVQQITLILGGSIIVRTEPFADNTELVEHFNGRRGHPFDFNIHSKTPFPKMPKCKGQEPSRGHKLSILENSCPFGTASCWGVGSPKPCRERVRQTGICKLVFANNL